MSTHEHDWSATQRHQAGGVYTSESGVCRKCGQERRKMLHGDGSEASAWFFYPQGDLLEPQDPLSAAVSRVEAVPVEELYDAFHRYPGNMTTSFEGVRARLIQAIKGEQ